MAAFRVHAAPVIGVGNKLERSSLIEPFWIVANPLNNLEAATLVEEVMLAVVDGTENNVDTQ